MSGGSRSLLLVGCGKMGRALLDAWICQSSPRYQITVVEPAASLNLPEVAASSLLRVHALAEVDERLLPDVILFAVKPQALAEMLPDYALRFGRHPLYLSIAAGKTLASFTGPLGAGARVVRAMPNMPAMVGMGVSALCASEAVTQEDRKQAQALMDAAGVALWLDNEYLMDVVTAISGSGPAYVFYFMECLMQAAAENGLDEDTARLLVLHTVRGSAELAFCSGEPLDALRRSITSPGGTTEAALDRLMHPSGLLPLLQTAVQAAVGRAEELARQD